MNEILGAFLTADIGARAESSPGTDRSWVIAYINTGGGGQRQSMVCVDDNGECRAFMSKIYRLPPGKTTNDIDIGEFPSLFTFPGTPPIPAATIVNRILEASSGNSETVEAKLREKPAPPVPLASLETVADLIRVHEQYYLNDTYHDALIAVLKKTGRVDFGDRQSWWFDPQIGHLTHTEFSPTSTRPLDGDGDRVIYPNAANIRLQPLLASQPQQ